MKLGRIVAVILTVAIITVASISVVQADPIYIGSYAIYDGTYWGSNPPVYSAREAAALIFGGSPTDYLISIDSSQDLVLLHLPLGMTAGANTMA